MSSVNTLSNAGVIETVALIATRAPPTRFTDTVNGAELEESMILDGVMGLSCRDPAGLSCARILKLIKFDCDTIFATGEDIPIVNEWSSDGMPLATTENEITIRAEAEGIVT